MNNAMGAKQGFFYKFARYLSEKGWLVVTYDYSGIGLSALDTLKGLEVSASDWAKYDLTAVVEYLERKYDYQHLLLIGQSIGGQIIGLSPIAQRASGLIYIASQLAYWKLWPFPQSLALWGNYTFITTITHLVGYCPTKSLNIMENLPKNVALEWAKWGKSSNYLFDYIAEADEQYAKLNVPLLAYSFSDDRSGPIASIKALNERHSNCTIIHKHFTPKEVGVKKIGHFGFFRSSCQILWDDMITEVEQTIG